MTTAHSVDQLLAAALGYAARGWRVLPVRAGDKLPATEHGVKDATSSEAQIRAWWSSVPFNIGIATGPESGIFVVDVDPRNGGEWTPDVPTYSVRTGGGGWHYYFNWPAGAAKMRSRLAQGVDIKGAGGYVVAPPSVTEGSYTADGAGAPRAVLDASPRLLSEVAIAVGAVDVDARPGDNFNATHTLSELLESYGWQSTGRMMDNAGDAVEGWTRPGKDEGISATVGVRSQLGDPKELLYVFTTSTSLEPGRGYDAFGFYAAMEFDGDVSAAAASLTAPSIPLRATTGLEGPLEHPQAVSSLPGAAPPPPAGYQFTPALPPQHWVSRYIEYASLLTDAAYEYHEAAALALLSAVTANVRIELAVAPEGLHTNLYLALVGESSRSRKSTVQAIAASFVRDLFKGTQYPPLLPDRSSGEALLRDLALRSGHTALWMPDELGESVSEVSATGWMSATWSLWLTLYSGQSFKYSTLGGDTTIEGVHFCILGASTPESWAGVGSRAISSGLLPRFGIIYPETPPPSRPVGATTYEQAVLRTGLLAELRQVLFNVSRPGVSQRVTFSPGALELLGEADARFSRHRLTSRLSVAAYKVAALLAVTNGEYEVFPLTASSALRIVDRWAEGAMRLRYHLGQPATDYAFMELLEICREKLRAASPQLGLVAGRKVMTRQDAARVLKLEHRTLNRVRDTLTDTGEVQVTKEDGTEEWHLAL